MSLTIKEEVNRDFFNEMIDFISEEGHLSRADAQKLVDPFRERIDTDLPYIQHTGPIYFAEKILMQEGLIPFRQM
ncbi:hypothetical protein [Furfurilactobacillus rossiae]|uniref:Uncharacterized protein n=1 Tax=Furfurilactobacillus rossiae DSM 15814 TaxID=1114972 RepID=A0A0R1RLY1_9LACO|nr:hypothetical protein [Furfurilactobacillus rossiae]KRL56116.1 hypothetical protein FD35_GL002156 [Furfurilactobacillus rossiae DSM 15814]MCF6166619.1 hypothetical protein [Furfurilactobacillus rossiae]QFR66142.1 hypothetical protein LR814_03010 [Furfurilactobacillus rossiae]QLE61572.1 hypothetical protein LROSRS0_1526 [Furfurilactobacillus rossiae]QLE64367.1 hypothetical protein LROSL1_1550 [Furfurilactobacillus rossiae]